jgi:hypothetical protein
MAWADTANAGQLMAVEGWLTALGWGIPCPAPPPKLFGQGAPADSPFVRCPGGWIIPEDAPPEQAPGTGALAPTGFGIPVQASAYADFAPDPGAIADYQAPPRHGTYLLRHVGIRGGRPTGWQVVGRLDPIDEVIARASGPRPPFERLWRPLDPADNPFPYSCSEGLTFTTADLEAATGLDKMPPSLAEAIARSGEQVADRVADWYVVTREEYRVVALAPWPDGRRLVDDQVLAADAGGPTGVEPGWDFEVGGSGCRPRAHLDDVGVGRWRLDPAYPPPGPKTRTLHVLGYLGCNGTRKAGRARVHVLDDAVLVAIPMRSIVWSDMCHGLGPTRMTVRLPEPLGHRTLYDAATLPIRQVVARPSRGDGGQAR